MGSIDIEFKMFMRKVISLLKQTTPLQICTAPFLNSPELEEFNSVFLLDLASTFVQYKLDWKPLLRSATQSSHVLFISSDRFPLYSLNRRFFDGRLGS